MKLARPIDNRNRRFRGTLYVFVLLLSAGCSLFEADEGAAALLADLSSGSQLRSTTDRFKEAVDKARRNVEESERLDEALPELAYLYHANGFYDDALKCYAVLQELDPDGAKWKYMRAHILSDFGKVSEAEKLYRESIKLDSDYVYSYIRLANSLFKGGDYEEAEKWYKSALVLDGSNGYALLGLGRVAHKRSDLENAVKFLKQSGESKAGVVEAWRLLEPIYNSLGKEKEAIDARVRGQTFTKHMEDPYLDELMLHCYDAYRLTVVARIKEIGEDFDQARVYLERAVTVEPDHAFAHAEMGDLYRRFRRGKEAEFHLLKSIELDSGDDTTWDLLLALYRDLGPRKKMDSTLAEALERKPNSSLLLTWKATDLMQRRNYVEAIVCFEQIIQARPDDVKAHLGLAEAHFRLSRFDKGVECFKDVLEIEPTHPRALAEVAKYSIYYYEKSEAEHYLDLALANPDVPENYKEELKKRFQMRYGGAEQ